MQQRNIGIFISSTFNDMQSERDIINKHVVPRLKEELADYHVSIQVTDLRWGVDTLSVEEGEREAKVLHVCLEAIQSSRPYFVALLGERYGWLPSADSIANIKRTLSTEQQQAMVDVSDTMSVTEMEILLGALGNQDWMPHSFFCLRSQASYNNMPSQKKRLFVDSLSSNEDAKKNAIRLERLKSRIEHRCRKAGLEQNIVKYDAQWNEETGKFEHLESFADQLYHLIYNDIISDIKVSDTGDDTYQQKDAEYNKFLTFVESHVEDFQGRRPLVDRLLQFFLESGGLPSVLNGITGCFLSGFSGCGKSSLFSILYQRLATVASKHSFYILAHVAGITPRSVVAEKMISAWCLQMKMTLNDDIEDGIDKDESIYNRKSQLLDEFKKLLSRIQARGFQPIVLIDSLDSFESNDIIRVFDFLPFDVPFFCTTLPDYADEIVKKHPNYGCYNMDSFMLDDAQQVITFVLKKNHKELPENLQKQLLNIKKEDGHPAYESPLWLRLALDILMELGEDDFNRIHNIQLLREDAKIEKYLSKIIGEFPSDASALFGYFIDLTCRYFNPIQTRQSLTYIAIAQYGIKEDDLAALIGKEWSQLDFVSLRYWMRNYIQCNNEDHRWFFTHSILRQTLMQQPVDYLSTSQDKFYNHLIENISQNDEEKKELIHQLIVRQETSVFQKNAYELAPVFLNILIPEYNLNPEATIGFMRKFIEQYYTEDSYVTNEVVREFLYKSKDSMDSPYYKAALSLHNYHVSHFKNDDFLKGLDIFVNYFEAYKSFDEHIYCYDKAERYLEFFQKLIPVYEQMKERFGEEALQYSLNDSYFTYWRHYIIKLGVKCRSEEGYHGQYCDCIVGYLDDFAQWCSCNDEEDVYFEESIDVVDDGGLLSTEELIGIMLQMQRKMLWLIKNSKVPVQKTIEHARSLIREYVNLFDSKDEVSETELMEYLSYSPSPEERHHYPICQVSDELHEDKTTNISFKSLSDDEDGEWISIDLNTMDSDSLSKLLKHGHDGEGKETDDYEENVGAPTDEDIRAMEQKLDEYLKGESTLRPIFPISEDAKAKLREKSLLYQRLALLYLKAGYTERGNNLLNQLGHLLVGFIINMGDNYAIEDDAAEDIIKYGEFLGKLGCMEEQLKQAEAIFEALLHSYYHHENGNSQRRIYDYLLKLYDENNMTDKKIDLLERMYEIAIRNHIERRFDSYGCYLRDLGYVRPIFMALFKELKAANKIQEGVITLERWVNLCHSNYIDEEDTIGYDDLDNAYDMLASLYDGTPAITVGMKTRNSVFLKEPYIMVCLAGKWGYIDHEGQVVIPLIYSRAWKAEPECLSVSRNTQWGYIDLHGNEMTFFGKYNFQLEVAVPIRNGWGRIRFNGKWAEFHIPDVFLPIKVDCDQFFNITDGLTKVGVETEDGYHQDFLLQDGESLLFDGTKHSVKTPNRGVIVASWFNIDEEENDCSHAAIYDMHGNELTKPGRYAAIGAFGKQELSPTCTIDYYAGYLNRLGQEISSFAYKHCRPFACGLGAVCKEGIYPYGQWGFVNEHGKEVIPPQYIDVGDFHEGLAWVCLDNGTMNGFNWRGGKFGFINTNGEMVIPAVYDDVSSFYESKALVWQKERAFYINKEGEVIEDF